MTTKKALTDRERLDRLEAAVAELCIAFYTPGDKTRMWRTSANIHALFVEVFGVDPIA